MVTSLWPSKRLELQSPLLKSGRVVLVRVWHPKFSGGLVVDSVYLFSGEGWSNRNKELLGELAEELLFCECPFVVFGDWNLEGVEFEASGWAGSVGGAVVRCRQNTFSGGAGSEIDFAVVSLELCEMIAGIGFVEDAPVSPHKAIELDFEGLSDDCLVTVRRKRLPLPKRLPIGCSLPPPELTWAWPAGVPPAHYGKAWAEWYANVELEVLDAAVVPLEDRYPYLGRAEGFKLVKRPVKHIWREGLRQRTSAQVRIWTALLSYLRQATSAATCGRLRSSTR